MELDELKGRWQEQEQKLDAVVRLNQHLLREVVLGKAETALQRLVRLLWLELLLNAVATILLGGFLFDHLAEPRFFLPALALQVGFLFLIIAASRQLAALAGINYDAPVVEIQRRLASLQAERIRTMKWTLLLAPLAWVPLFIVGMKGFFDVDVHATFSIPWLVANVLFGLLVIPIGVWASRRYADRLEDWPLARRLLRDIGGQNLAAARSFLDSLSELGEEKHEAAGPAGAREPGGR
jgi:serine/threonine-protein kinase